MNIKLEIDYLILENINLSPRERRQLQAVIETQLSDLLTINKLPTNIQLTNTISKLNIDINVTATNNILHMGKELAQAIYERISVQGDRQSY